MLVHEVGYDTAVSAQPGERFDKAVQAAASRAAESPDLGSPYIHGARRVFAKRFKFSVVYLMHEQEVVILAIAPFSRKPGYWRLRKSDAWPFAQHTAAQRRRQIRIALHRQPPRLRKSAWPPLARIGPSRHRGRPPCRSGHALTSAVRPLHAAG